MLNCPENFSQQDMDERYVDTSFNGVNFIHESCSDLNDLPSPADFEEIISPASYGTCVSLKSLLDCKYGPHAGMATDSLKVFDLQRMIDNAVPFQTLLIPPRQVMIDNLVVTQPIVLKGSSPSSVLVVNGWIKISLQSSFSNSLCLKKSAIQSPSHMRSMVTLQSRLETPVIGGLFVDNLKIFKCNASNIQGALFVLSENSELTLRDCQISSKSGYNELVSVPCDNKCKLDIKTCTMHGFTSLSSLSPKKLELLDSIVADCQNTPVVLRDFEYARVVSCTFSNIADTCIRVDAGVSRGISSVVIDNCRFSCLLNNAIFIEAPSSDTPCLDCLITSSIFDDIDGRSVQVNFASCVHFLVADCSFSKTRDDCILFESCNNYKVIHCNFEDVSGVCIDIHGGQGIIEKCFFYKAMTGVRILGEPQARPATKKSGVRAEEVMVRPLNLRLISQDRPSVEVNKSSFEKLAGNGIEITDTCSIDCAFAENMINECLNGFMIRDFNMTNMSTLGVQPTATLSSERTNALKSLSWNSFGSPMVNTSNIEGARTYRLANNVVMMNRGSGLKIENTATLVHVIGGQIMYNKDFAIGVVGNLERSVAVEKSGNKKVAISGKVKEIKFEEDHDQQDKCTLI